MRQSEPQRITGWFYLPEDPSNRVPGVLTWDPGDGATLELIGGFSPGPEFRRNPTGGRVATNFVGDVRPGTVYGETVAGKQISVWDAQRGSPTAGFDGAVREEFWHSSWMCVGAHIISPQEPALVKATITIDELYYLTDDGRFCAPQWATIEGLELENPGKKQPDGTLLTPYILPVVGGYRAEYARADTSDASYAIATTATRPWISPATEAMPGLKLDMMTTNLRSGPQVLLQVSAHACIELPDKVPGSVADFADRKPAVDDLVQLATFESCGTSKMSLQTASDDSISLLMHTGRTARPDDPHKPTAIVFTLADVTLEAYLQTRQRFTDSLQSSYAWSVVVGLCGHSSRIVEEYVSQALAAAEGFHRWCLGGGSNVTLNTRLQALHDRLAPEVQAALGLDVAHWASWAVWARNHVAHGGTHAWRPHSDSFQLHPVAESVHLVTYLVALEELGVPEAKVLDALLNHPRLSALVERCSQVNGLGDAT